MVSKIDRTDLLAYKQKKSLEYDKDKILISSLFDKTYNHNNLIIASWNETKNYFDNYNNVNLFPINNMGANLRSIFVFKIFNEKKFFWKNNYCDFRNCNICKLKYEKSFLELNNGFIIPLLDVNCKSLNCVYIIMCLKCNIFYIGETGNLKDRISHHISNIKNFKNFKRPFTEISSHFGCLDHNIEMFKWCVFKHNIFEKEFQSYNRKTLEQLLLRLFIKCGSFTINEKFFKNQTKSFIFSFNPSLM
jgi:hypothetical protein